MINNKIKTAKPGRRFRLLRPAQTSQPENNKIAITIGDVAGIGPEVIIKSLLSPQIMPDINKYLLIGSKYMFEKAAFEMGIILPENLEILDIPIDSTKIIKGKPTKESGKHSFLALKQACKLSKQKLIRAIVTAPVSKEAINKAGYFFSGQTEILKDLLTKGKNSIPEMLFVAGELRVMILTRHIRLGAVSSELNINGIMRSINSLNSSLIRDFKIENPKIALCGVNPHAGENSILGHEENYLLKPAIEKLKKKIELNIDGPFPADTLWAKTARTYLSNEKLPYDAYIACYHDQGLIPVKMLAMDKAVNISINLPIIRTSPSHGTAYDIAGQNIADFSSMIEAIKLAESLSIDTIVLDKTKL